MSDHDHRYAMIMAGGSGTRLWPMSRQNRPKQLLPFIHGRSLLELAAQRLEGIVPPTRRYICTGEQYRSVIRQTLPQFSDEQILGEPVGRDTVNAVGLTAAVLAGRDPKAVFLVLTADHIIEPPEEFARCAELGFRIVEDDPTRFVTFSIRPTFPATAYGWLERGDPIPRFEGGYVVRRFIEKPDRAEAERYLRSPEYGWNSGMFVFHAVTFLKALAQYEPESHRGLMRVAEAWETPQQEAVLGEIYPTLPKVSVDFAVMEPASTGGEFTVCCIPMNARWKDVGSWPSYGETLEADEEGNCTNGRAVHAGSRKVLAISDDPAHLIATIGCEDLIIVHTADATLVCPRSQAQKVRELVKALDEELR